MDPDLYDEFGNYIGPDLEIVQLFSQCKTEISKFCDPNKIMSSADVSSQFCRPQELRDRPLRQRLRISPAQSLFRLRQGREEDWREDHGDWR